MTHVQLEKWMGLQERPWMEKNEQLQNDLQKNTCYPVWFFGLSFAVEHIILQQTCWCTQTLFFNL